MTTPTHSPEPWQTTVCPYCESIVATSKLSGRAVLAELARLREQNRRLLGLLNRILDESDSAFDYSNNEARVPALAKAIRQARAALAEGGKE